MEHKDWLILKTINEERNITKTAERLFISQPALTYRLKGLEKDMGVRILNRHKNGVSLTAQGEYLVKYAEEMIEKLEYVKTYVRDMESHIKGTVRLGVSSVVAKFKMAPLLKSFKKQYPDIKVPLQTGSSTLQLPDMIKNREIDIALLRGDVLWTEKKHVIAEEPMCILFSKPIHIEQLYNFPRIRYEASIITKSDEQIQQWWQEQTPLPLPNTIKVDSIEACIQMVSYGLGWCVVPKIHITNRNSLHSSPIVWRNGRTMIRKTVMIYRSESLDHQEKRLFIDHVLRNYSK